MPQLRRAGPRTTAQRWAAAAAVASTIGLLALIGIVVLQLSDRPVPAPLVVQALLLPAGLSTLLALIVAEARRRR